jgi:hypothetical protein
MLHNRFNIEVEAVRLPRPPLHAIVPKAFVLCPATIVQGLTVEQRAFPQWIYQKAFEEARAVVRPSLPERDLLGVWN